MTTALIAKIGFGLLAIALFAIAIQASIKAVRMPKDATFSERAQTFWHSVSHPTKPFRRSVSTA